MRIGFMNGVMRVASCLVLWLVLVSLPVAAGEVTSSVDMKLWGRAIFNTHYDTAILSQDFEGGLGAWTVTGLWHLQSGSACLGTQFKRQ